MLLATLSDLLATFPRAHCCVTSSLSLVNTQRFRPKEPRFHRLFQASRGRTNGRFGDTVTAASWIQTPRRFVIGIITVPQTHPTTSITIGSRSWSVELRK